MRVSSDRKPTKKPTAQTDQCEKKYDIRAGNQIKQWSMLEFNWLRSLFLIASDTLGLGIAWQISQRLNQDFSPLPPELNWGEFAGFTGLFWDFAPPKDTAFHKHNFKRE